MSEKMSTERAAKILDPKHRESYESLAIVEEACQMGRDALLLRIPRSPYKKRALLVRTAVPATTCTATSTNRTSAAATAGRPFCGRMKYERQERIQALPISAQPYEES
jgi:hypothetical protein